MERWRMTARRRPTARPATARGGTEGGGRGRRARLGGRWAAAALCVLAGPLVSTPAAGAQTFLTQEEALELAFGPEARVERRTAYLGEEELRRAEELAGEPVEGGVVTHYAGFRDGEPVGVAYFDVHRVRTLDEVLMVVVEPGGRVGRVEVLRFAEPPDYLAPDGWLEQFVGRDLGPELAVGEGIVNMTGATLTSSAATRAVRRVLALHAVVAPFGEGGTPPDAPGGRRRGGTRRP